MPSEPLQRDFAGGETPVRTVNRARAPLSSAQQEILRGLREHGGLARRVAEGIYMPRAVRNG